MGGGINRTEDAPVRSPTPEPNGPGFARGHHPEHFTELEKARAEGRSRLAAVVAAVLVHLLIIALLAWVLVGSIIPDPPEISIAPAAGAEQIKLPERLPYSQLQRKPSFAGAASFEVLNTPAPAPVAFVTISSPSAESFGNGLGDSFGAGLEGIGSGSWGPPIPPPIKHRCSQADRAKRLRENGGKPSLDGQVVKALKWLQSQQNADGSWGQTYPVAMTGFAILAFSGHCETVDSPRFGKTLVKAIDYLVGQSRQNGGLLSSGNAAHSPYEHGIATYALAEAYSLNRNARTKVSPIMPALRNAVPVIIEGQTRAGGWLYGYRQSGAGDLSISGWNIQALKAAELTGVRFTGLGRAMKQARAYIQSAESPDGLYLYRIRDGERGRLSLTGVGVLSARMLGRAMPGEEKSLAAIVAHQPKSYRSSDPYALYYHSQACFQKGGRTWEAYNRNQQRLIIDAQERDGSWPVASGHLGAAGADAKIYHTCLCTLMLEVYYRYLPATNL